MLKATFLHPNADIEYFKRHHLEMAKALPGLRRFTISPAIPNPLTGDPPPFNLINEVYFDGADAYKRAYTSKEAEIAVDDVAKFSDMSSILWVVSMEEQIVP